MASAEVRTGGGAAGLQELLDLEQLGEHVFRGRSRQPATTRVFGGQVAAQALVAAGRTVRDAHPVHSLHGYFLRPGNPAEPIDYLVEEVRDGRSLATRRVTAVQGDEEVFMSAASFHRLEEGVAHQLPVAEPFAAEDVPPAERVMELADDATRTWLTAIQDLFPLDVRFLDEPIRAAVVRGERPAPRQRFLVRSSSSLPDDPLVHVCAAAYVSDLFLLSTALAPHGLLMGHPAVSAASLDHALWFHTPFRADEWLLYEMEGIWAGHGRALCRGHLFDARGNLLASVVQEGRVRPRAPEGSRD
ncbi:MAG: Acyl-CoA thioesterase [Frankiales bacterium]|nr:Acyl-CoA thioesterase [Frankiales bacterium]